MKLFHLALLVPLIGWSAEAGATEKEDAFSHALALVQILTRIAAHSDDPDKAFDELLAGRSPEANRAAAGLLEEATTDLSPEQRARVASIGQNLLVLGRRSAGADRALQARKDLTAMGLRYYDSRDFLDAVGRGDRLAVELFLEGRGVDPAARDEEGRTALDIARAQNQHAMAELLAREALEKR
jgi:hypothetical protein